MKFAVQTHPVEHLAPVTFETAIVVVQHHAGDAADHPIEDARRPNLVPRIVSDAASNR